MEQQPVQILVVDDEASIRFTLEALLRRCGYAVTLAVDGLAALAQIHTRTFDLVLLDLIMPGLGGLEVARRIHALQPTAAILILTGSDTLERVEPGEHEYLLKTASPHEVLARIAALIARQQAAALPHDAACSMASHPAAAASENDTKVREFGSTT